MTLVICTKQKIYWQQSWHSLYSLLALSSGVLSLTKSTVLASQTPNLRTTSTLRLVGVFSSSSFLFLDNSVVIMEWERFES